MSASEEEDNQVIDEDPVNENNASSSDESESGDSVINSPNDGGGEANEEEEGDRETIQSGEGMFPGEGSEEEEDEMASVVASASAQASKFISEAISEEEEGGGEELGAELQSREGEKEGEANSEEGDGEDEETGAQAREEEKEEEEQPEQGSDTEEGAPEVGGVEGVAREEKDTLAAAIGGEGAGDNIEEGSPFRDSDEEEASPPTKKQKLDEAEEIESGSEGGEGGEGGEELSELQQEVADLEELGERPTDTSEVTVGGVNLGEEEEEGSEDEVEDRNRDVVGVSDWDLMMQRRKEAMARARKRKRKDIDINASDDFIMNLIGGMKVAAQEDKQLNLAGKAATKKLQMLPTVMSHLKNGDLQTAFIECGILTALAEWLTPLPHHPHPLPHLKIRTSILDILSTYPTPDSSILKSSKIGKAVMLLYRHPKESRKNREKAGKLVNEWARPIFGVASDMKSLSRDKREERDYANLSQAARRRLSSSGERRTSQDEEYQPQKPGDKGWVGRARVPMPSTKDYVVRPKGNVEHEFKRGPTKKVLNRYEEHLRKKKQAKQQSKATHAVSISIEGRRMPL